MAKSVEELRSALKRMRQQLEKIPVASPSAVSFDPPTKPRQIEPAARTPRLLREDGPVPARSEASKTSLPEENRRITPDFLRMAVVGGCAGMAVAGGFVDSRLFLIAGIVGLASVAVWPGREHGSSRNSSDIAKLTARVDALDRRVSSLTLPEGGSGVPPGLVEDIYELRTLVKTLFKALEESPADLKDEEYP